jgi:hypothetical protein
MMKTQLTDSTFEETVVNIVIKELQQMVGDERISSSMASGLMAAFVVYQEPILSQMEHLSRRALRNALKKMLAQALYHKLANEALANSISEENNTTIPTLQTRETPVKDTRTPLNASALVNEPIMTDKPNHDFGVWHTEPYPESNFPLVIVEYVNGERFAGRANDVKWAYPPPNALCVKRWRIIPE